MKYPALIDAVGLIVILLIIWSMYRAHRNNLMRDFSLFDLLMENGRVSKIACITMGTWGALVYVFIGTYIDGKMTEGLYTAFGGLCFAPLIAKMFSGPSTTITSTSTTEVTQK